MNSHRPRPGFWRANSFAAIVFAISFCLFLGLLSALAYVLDKNAFRPQHSGALSGDVAWPAFNGGVDDLGANYKETALNTGNVAGLQQLWKAPTPAPSDTAVAEWPNVNTASGTKDLLFVNTIKGNLLALDAATGAKVWEADPSAANFNSQGTKSTPAVDPSGTAVYAYALDGYIHKYNIASGIEITGGGFPAQATILPNDIEKGSGSLNIANGYLYMTISGNDGDYGHYTGHVVAVNLASGAKTVWNAECSNITQLLGASGANYCANNQSGIWERPGAVVDPVTGNVFVAIGNGNYNADSGGHNWGDSIVELKPDLSQVVDSFTPPSFGSLDHTDADLGSSAPVIVPTQSASNKPYLLVQGGKDHLLRVFDRTNLSGQGGPGHLGGELSSAPISDEIHGQPALWTDSSGTPWIFCDDIGGNLYAFKLTVSGGTPKLQQVYKKQMGVSSSPFVANGVLYLDGDSILALDPTTGDTLFDSKSIGITLNQHWESPVVVNGRLFTADNGGNVFALHNPAAVPTPSPTPTPTPQPGPTPPPSGKPGDADGDGHVTLVDLSILLRNYRKSGPGIAGDCNNDGQVTLVDLSILLANYGK